MISRFQRHIRILPVLLLCGAGSLMSAGCGDGSPSPTSPSAATGSGTAVIDGVLTAASGFTSSLQDVREARVSATDAPLPGVTIHVMGTDVSAVANEAGGFRLAGVPAGKVRLQFRSDSVNATTDLADVRANELVQIQVRLTSSSAQVVTDERVAGVSMCHAEGNGTYHSITIDDSAEAAHRAHGDGKVGEPVPGRSLMVFEEDCTPAGPAIEIRKFTNGDDADAAPGPSIEVGQPVTWEYRVTNAGTVSLTGLLVTDDKGVTVTCGGTTTLAAGATATCTGNGVAVLGQYRNVGTVSANFVFRSVSGSVTSSNPSHYLGVAPAEDGEQEAKVTLCHKTGAGFYVKVEVGASAEPAHRAHGDAKIGEAVPGVAGKTFSSSCSVQ